MVTKSNGMDGSRSVPFLRSCRLTLSIYGFLGTTFLYMMRTNMSVAIVCMTTDPNVTEPIDDVTYAVAVSAAHGGHVNYCPGMGNNSDNTLQETGEFEWSRDLKGWVLSAFYVGYLLTQVPAGWVVRKLGGRWLVGFSLISLSMLSLLSPVAARGSVYLLIFVQALKGAVSGLYYPSFFQMWGKWAPPSERSMLTAIYMSGAPVGSVLSSIFSGLFCASNILGGWPSVFYIFGIISLVWCVGWYVLAFDSPASHPRVSQAEREFIESSLETEDNMTLAVPWRSLFSTVPLYAIFVSDFCYGWGWLVALTTIPQFMKDVFKFDIKQNGFYNSLPYICNFAITVLGSFLADGILSRDLLSRTWTRKLLQTLAFIPSAGFAIGVAFLTCYDVTLGVALLSLWVGLMGCTRSGSLINLMDLAPAYSGALMGIDNTLASIPGVIGPPIIGAMTPTGSQAEWQTTFFVSAGVFLFGWLCYMTFGDAREQPWAKTQVNVRTQLPEAHTNPGFAPEDTDRGLQN